jgi:hypothetical protein
MSINVLNQNVFITIYDKSSISSNYLFTLDTLHSRFHKSLK